jgi:hypothetical protein
VIVRVLLMPWTERRAKTPGPNSESRKHYKAGRSHTAALIYPDHASWKELGRLPIMLQSEMGLRRRAWSSSV